MKKIIALSLCLISIAVFCVGCGYQDALLNNQSTNTSTSEATTDEAANDIKSSDFEDSFNGLCSYFVKKGYIEDKENLVTKMDASLIGAVQGNKYTVRYEGKNVNIELYAYDLNNLSKEAEDIINSVKSDNKFQILDLPVVEAYLSDNGKYLMVYYDESIDANEPNENSKNYIHKQEVIEDFKSFNK